MSMLTAGQHIRSKYTIERFLGEGAFAEVYRAQHRFLGRQAVKVMKATASDVDEMEQSLGEAMLLSRIGHPNIIRVFDADCLEIDGNTHGFFTMEYVPGGSLDALWRSYRNRLMPVAEAVEVARQICTGVSVAHGESPPVVHRDIKPHNVLVGYDGAALRVRVADFGLAKRVSPLTLLVSSQGTLQFKAPESFDNHESPTADVWAIGVTLYLLLTDQMPFPELEDRGIKDAKRFLKPMRPARVFNISVDARLEAILERALAPRCSDRYADAGEMLADLQRWRPTDVEARLPSDSQGVPRDKQGVRALAGMDTRTAQQLAAAAMDLAKRPGSLMLAADMLEEAMTRDPVLRDQMGGLLLLWRKGICM
jgi:serine/threonine protein kinase